MKTLARVWVLAWWIGGCSGGADERAQLAAEEAQRQVAAATAAREQAEAMAAAEQARAQAEAEAAAALAAATALPPGVAHVPVEIGADERAGGDTPWSAYGGQGFRYQVPPGFTSARSADGGQAWTGTVSSMIDDAPVALTLFVTRAPFAGDLAAWEAAETARITGANGQVESMDAVIFGDGGGPAKQLTITEGDRRRLVRGFVRDGFVYAATCEADRTQFLGIMSDCAIAVSTLHVEP